MISTSALPDTISSGRYHRASAQSWSSPSRAGSLVRAGRTPEPANEQSATVHVVGFDEELQGIVCERFCAVGVESKTYADVGAFVRGGRPQAPGCLLVYAGSPLNGGLEFLDHFHRAGANPPIVVVADRADVRMVVLAMKAGAVDFLEKALCDEDLLEAVGTAIRIDHERRRADLFHAELRMRFETLTPREREVMELVTQGLLNKQVGGELGITEFTVKVHRGSAMRKMGARALTDLVRMADAIAGSSEPLSS
jgi:FixJ family two-component response regulator